MTIHTYDYPTYHIYMLIINIYVLLWSVWYRAWYSNDKYIRSLNRNNSLYFMDIIWCIIGGQDDVIMLFPHAWLCFLSWYTPVLSQLTFARSYFRTWMEIEAAVLAYNISAWEPCIADNHILLTSLSNYYSQSKGDRFCKECLVNVIKFLSCVLWFIMNLFADN